MKNLLVLILIFSSVSCASSTMRASSSNDNISFAFSEIGWDKKSNGSLSSEWHVFDRTELYKITLSEVENIYGKAISYRPDTRSYSPSLLCYLSPDNNVVVFQSGPLGGWSKVTAILIAKKDEYYDKRCIETKEIQQYSIGGLSLGLNQQEVNALLGNPSYKDKHFSAYRYEQKRRSKIEKNLDIYVTSGIEIGYSETGVVKWFRVYWQEST